MNKINLVVQLTGLCAYVLKYPRQENNNAMRVIMPSDTYDIPEMRMEPHVPALVFDPRDLAGSNERPYEVFTSHKTTRAYCRLDGQDLRIGGKDPKLKPNLTAITKPCPTDDNKKSLYWLAPIPDVLAECGSGYGDMDPCCLDDNNVPPSVAARVRLTDGILYTSRIFSREEHPVIWAAGHCRQAFAEELTLEFEVSGERYEVVTRSFLVGSDYAPLVFKRPGSGKLFLKIVHLPEDDLKEARVPDVISTGQPRKSDRHFQMFYGLSSLGMPSGHMSLPFPIAVCKDPLVDSSGPSAGNPQCPGSTYNPHPGA
jgi:hypothetical protein